MIQSAESLIQRLQGQIIHRARGTNTNACLRNCNRRAGEFSGYRVPVIAYQTHHPRENDTAMERFIDQTTGDGRANIAKKFTCLAGLTTLNEATTLNESHPAICISPDVGEGTALTKDETIDDLLLVELIDGNGVTTAANFVLGCSIMEENVAGVPLGSGTWWFQTLRLILNRCNLGRSDRI